MQMNSFILQVINEADEMALPAEAPTAAPTAPAAVSPEAAMADVTPVEPAVQAPMGAAAFPQGQLPQSATVQKTVLNKELILAIFSEIKSLVSNYEKKLSADETPFEDATIYIQSMLGALAYNANKLDKLIQTSAVPTQAEPTPAPVEPNPTPAAPPVVSPTAAFGMPEPEGDIF